MTTIDDDVPAGAPAAAPSVTTAAALAGRVADEVERAVIGKRDVIDLVRGAILRGEFTPGLRKPRAGR